MIGDSLVSFDRKKIALIAESADVILAHGTDILPSHAGEEVSHAAAFLEYTVPLVTSGHLALFARSTFAGE